MVVATEPKAEQRAPLTRDRIVHAALRYIDTHGLAGLSMHKLGAELNVKAMSLYKYVANKDDLLDGVVEELWLEVEHGAPAQADWRDGYRSFARALRDMVYRHANAATLITSHVSMPAASLRCIRTQIAAASGNGVPEDRAYAWLRTITSYALGTALNDVAWGAGQETCQARTVAELLRAGIPPDLAEVAEIFCGQADAEAQFELGLGLMLRGIDT
ncbi:MAG: TetR family transcriptional regulator [Actinophytocola sp.]|nr:TetR family transcriptional regulator [Actinophytocola sp.]